MKLNRLVNLTKIMRYGQTKKKKTKKQTTQKKKKKKKKQQQQKKQKKTSKTSLAASYFTWAVTIQIDICEGML